MSTEMLTQRLLRYNVVKRELLQKEVVYSRILHYAEKNLYKEYSLTRLVQVPSGAFKNALGVARRVVRELSLIVKVELE